MCIHEQLFNHRNDPRRVRRLVEKRANGAGYKDVVRLRFFGTLVDSVGPDVLRFASLSLSLRLHGHCPYDDDDVVRGIIGWGDG